MLATMTARNGSGLPDVRVVPKIEEQNLAPKLMCIDLSSVTHIDSSGIATLIEALKIARRHKTELRLQGLHDALLRIFQVTGLVSLFKGSSQTMPHSGREVV